MTEKLLEKCLDIFTKEILPITEKGVSEGNKIFGAAILKKYDFPIYISTKSRIISSFILMKRWGAPGASVYVRRAGWPGLSSRDA